MLKLNLVSQELRAEIKLRHIYNLQKKINYIFIIILAVITTILLSAKAILQNTFNKTVEQTTLVTKSNQSYNSRVRTINHKLGYVAKIQDEFIYFSYLMEDISKMATGNINLYLVKINLQDNTIVVKGKSGLRDDLLALKRNMENSNLFENINFPLKNILEKQDVDFEIDGKIKAQNLVK